MERFSKEKVTSISLSIHSINELEDLIIKMAKLLKEGYSIDTISNFEYKYTTHNIIQNDPLFTIELNKSTI